MQLCSALVHNGKLGTIPIAANCLPYKGQQRPELIWLYGFTWYRLSPVAKSTSIYILDHTSQHGTSFLTDGTTAAQRDAKKTVAVNGNCVKLISEHMAIFYYIRSHDN